MVVCLNNFVLQQILFEYVLKRFAISGRLLMKFLVGFDFTGTIKLILIIANFHCMLFFTHSLITDMT